MDIPEWVKDPTDEQQLVGRLAAMTGDFVAKAVLYCLVVAALWKYLG